MVTHDDLSLKYLQMNNYMNLNRTWHRKYEKVKLAVKGLTFDFPYF